MDFVLCNIDKTTADKILKNFDLAKSSAIDQISVIFLKDGATEIAIDLASIINVPIKHVDTFPLKCKIAKPSFK